MFKSISRAIMGRKLVVCNSCGKIVETWKHVIESSYECNMCRVIDAAVRQRTDSWAEVLDKKIAENRESFLQYLTGQSERISLLEEYQSKTFIPSENSLINLSKRISELESGRMGELVCSEDFLDNDAALKTSKKLPGKILQIHESKNAKLSPVRVDKNRKRKVDVTGVSWNKELSRFEAFMNGESLGTSTKKVRAVLMRWEAELQNLSIDQLKESESMKYLLGSKRRTFLKSRNIKSVPGIDFDNNGLDIKAVEFMKSRNIQNMKNA